MLKQIHIKNFAIISELIQEFREGFTVLTGETGAGKSIVIDALTVVLGERADSHLIPAHCERAEVTAEFAMATMPAARQWLEDNELLEGEACFIRRILNRDGRSRSTINGRPCSVQQVRELGGLLVHIHGQNQHTLLFKNDHQRALLDGFAGHESLCQQVRHHAQQYQQVQHRLNAIGNGEEHERQKDFLHFQWQELETLALSEGELTELVQEQVRLAHTEQWGSICQGVSDLLSEAEPVNVLQGLHLATQQLKNLSEKSTQMQPVVAMLTQAIIQVKEAELEVRHYLQTLEPNPDRLAAVDKRLAQLHDMARRHRITPEELWQKKNSLHQQWLELCAVDSEVVNYRQQQQQHRQNYDKVAAQLRQGRKKAAQLLGEQVTQQMRLLGMQQGEFAVQLMPYDDEVLRADGQERVEFLVRTNPGQPLFPLSKVASGGEVSRIALAIQVLTAQTSQCPTLIFDEVDVGIGGRTAEIVGQQLAQLGRDAQVLAITHLPQVAAQGDHHLQIVKQEKNGTVEPQINPLSTDERIAEIARMLGGVTITATTLAHAREMLQVL